MLPEIKLTITQNDKEIKTIIKEVNEHHLVQSLVEFQSTANAVLTKMIQELGDSGGDCIMDDEDGDSDEEEEDKQISPKKKKT